jgi:hypothetical protein
MPSAPRRSLGRRGSMAHVSAFACRRVSCRQEPTGSAAFLDVEQERNAQGVLRKFARRRGSRLIGSAFAPMSTAAAMPLPIHNEKASVLVLWAAEPRERFVRQAAPMHRQARIPSTLGYPSHQNPIVS